jgi:hypothetical protein
MTEPRAAPRPFDRATLEEAFERIGEMAVAAGKIVEISVYGGSALILSLNHRPATRDVGAVFEKDRAFVRRAAAVLADEFGWPDGWLNDGVKGFLSRADGDPGAKSLFRTFPSDGPIGLRVLIASPDYLFAMKCLSMRAGGASGQGDADDIRRLASALGIGTLDEALNAVARYYPAEALPPKTRFGIEELFGSAV